VRRPACNCRHLRLNRRALARRAFGSASGPNAAVVAAAAGTLGAERPGGAGLAPLGGQPGGAGGVRGASPPWASRMGAATPSEAGSAAASRSGRRPITAPAALSWDEQSREPFWDENSLASILSEMTLVKRDAARRARSERRRAREQERSKRTGGPVAHANRYGISTTCLYDSRGNSAASSWDKLPLFGAKKKVDLRRRRHAIAPITRRIHARPWLPVEQSGKLFGEPPTHAKKPRSRRGRDDGSSVCSAETLEVTGQGAATKLAPLQTALRPETR